MSVKGIHRIKAWTKSRLRRLRTSWNEILEERKERPAMVHRLQRRLIRLGERLEQPRNRRLMRWLTFVFLVGASYGLWQGSQDLVAPGQSLSSINNQAGGEPGTVTQLATRVGDSVLNASLPARLTGSVALAQAPETQSVATTQTLPAILDLSQVVWPVTGAVDGGYGWYRDPETEDWHFRSGLVLTPDRDPAPVRASLPGEVISIGTSGIGFHVVLAHAEGWRTEYVGLASVTVSVGTKVDAGDTIGEYASAPHRDGLHYVIRDASGNPADPSRILYTRTTG